MTTDNVTARLMTANHKRQPRVAAEICKADLKHFVEQQKLAKIAALGPNDDAREFQDETWMRHAIAAGAFCGIVGLSFATLYVILVGVFCL